MCFYRAEVTELCQPEAKPVLGKRLEPLANSCRVNKGITAADWSPDILLNGLISRPVVIIMFACSALCLSFSEFQVSGLFSGAHALLQITAGGT